MLAAVFSRGSEYPRYCVDDRISMKQMLRYGHLIRWMTYQTGGDKDMNRYLWRAFLAAVVLFVAVPVKAAMMSGRPGPSSGAFARSQFRTGAPSGAFTRGQFGMAGGFRQPAFRHDLAFGHNRFFAGHDFGHRHFFHNNRFFFSFGVPFYYYPYSYYYPPPYYYNDYGPAYDYSSVPDNNSYYPPSVPDSNGSSATYSAPTTSRSSTTVGHDWAQDLRLDIVTWDQFITYMKTNLASASVGARDEFRRGFVSAYGDNGDAAFAKALKDANVSETTATPQQPSNSGLKHY